MKSWLKVRRELSNTPLAEGFVSASIAGVSGLYMEHYLFRNIERTVSGLTGPSMVTQFGGARVREGESGAWRSTTLPSQSLLIPPACPTHWHYAGTVDFAVFYFPERAHGVTEQLRRLAVKTTDPMPFSDSLVSAIALELVRELHKGPGGDESFMAMLAPVMLEQTYRALTTPETGGFNPRHVHFSRLQAVLNHIRGNPGEDLSVTTLAAQAEVSVAHFRRLFQEAMGTPPHRYVLASRLEQARKLLSMTSLPIIRIADECGFSSQSHFTACFRKAHASTPADYRKNLQQPPAEPGRRQQ